MSTSTKRTTKTTKPSRASGGVRAESNSTADIFEPKPRLMKVGGFFIAQIPTGDRDVKNDPVIAIVGVTGAVGAEFIATLDRRNVRVGRLKALASARSAGQTLTFRGQTIVIEE